MRKAALHNLGCKVNAYETEAMRQLLEEAGYEIVPFSEQADVYVVNTCSVTNIADRKSRQMLHRAKKQNPGSIVVAVGCYVQAAKEQAREDHAVDLIIGNNRKNELPGLLAECWRRRGERAQGEGAQAAEGSWAEEGAQAVGNAWTEEGAQAAESAQIAKRACVEEIIDINNAAEAGGYESLSIGGAAERARAFVKVQDGCNQFCSYCIIPYVRGRVRSRGRADILKEAERLSENGYREVVLTGIHLSSYGVDTGDGLLPLIRQIHQIPGIHRIRLGSLEPKIVTEGFVGELSRLPKVCPHFHLSLQSGCDETLGRMNRRYTCQEYRQGCEILRRSYPHPAITTDVIVGFPGETEGEFEATRRFLREIGFFETHIFKYSPRRGTRAAEMADQVPEQVKARRSDCLFLDTKSMSRHFVEWYLGKRVQALLEGRAWIGGEEYFVGHTPEYVKIAVPVGEAAEGADLANQMASGVAERILPDHVLLCRHILTENMD